MANLIERDAKVFFHQSGSSPVEKTICNAQGVWAEDEDGHRFMDFQGNTCHNIGYRHPRLVQALKEQLDTLAFVPRTFTSEIVVELAERLVDLWPYGDARVLFAPSGADGVEMALKLAYIATGRVKTLAFEDAWHGAALGTLWVGGREADRTGLPRFEGCHHVMPYWQRDEDVTAQTSAERSLEAIKSLLVEGDFACFIAEPIRATPFVAPDWFWPEVRLLCDASGTLLIFDEVPTGLGKTGKFFASEHVGAAPDITVLGKSLGGGALPLSAVIARADLNVAKPMAIGHYTHQKNPLMARAGLTTLDVIRDEGLVNRAAQKGQAVLETLMRMAETSAVFSRATGIGLLLALEVAEPSELGALQRACFAAGLHLGTSDGRYLNISPPLMIADEDMERAIDILQRVGAGNESIEV